MLTDEGDKKANYHTYPTMMKLGSYTLPKEDPKIYESPDKRLEFC